MSDGLGNGGTGEHPDEVIQTIHTIQLTMDTIDKSLKQISAFGKRTRQITMALIISLVLDVTLTVVVAFLSANAISASEASSHESSTIRAIQTAQCEQANISRTENKGLWQFFIALAEAQKPTGDAQQQAYARSAISRLINEVNTTFAARPCP